jgi:hypothetical protein
MGYGIMILEPVFDRLPIVPKSIFPMPIRDPKPSRGYGCFFAILAASSLLIALGIFSFWASITGVELSPNNFQSRTFSYSRVPGTKSRIGSTKLGASTPVASTDVLKYLPTLNRPQEWHVASVSGWEEEKHSATILIDALRQRDADGLDAWGQWSLRQPNLAAVVWPLVQQVAFQHLYSCVPELLELAESTSDPVLLERELLDAIARVVVEHLRQSTEEAQPTALLSWFTALTVVNPQNIDWFEKRKESVRRTRDAVRL